MTPPTKTYTAGPVTSDVAKLIDDYIAQHEKWPRGDYRLEDWGLTDERGDKCIRVAPTAEAAVFKGPAVSFCINMQQRKVTRILYSPD